MRSQPLTRGSAADSRGRCVRRCADRRIRTDGDGYTYRRGGCGESSPHGHGSPDATTATGGYGYSNRIGANANPGGHAYRRS